ncbi:MAG: alpha/beta hydrolase [Chloroflexi bacterium]|nr:alpha/beta hydrolase [Chloroflexota bacterium]
MASSELKRVADERASAVVPDPPPDLATRRAGFDTMSAPIPDDVTVTEVEIDGVFADWVVAPNANLDSRILYLHGGGYSNGSKISHRGLAAAISSTSKSAVLVLDYRLAPEFTYPAAVEDALVAYGWMRNVGPQGEQDCRYTFIAGDSAGGGLTLATVLAAKESGIPLPDGCITLSAWTDLAATGDSVETRSEVDPILRDPAGLRFAASMYLGDTPANTPGASPLYGDFTDFPPLLMQVGDLEILLDDTVRVAELARSQGVKVDMHIEPEGYHVYPLFAPNAPESIAAIEQIGDFVQKITN